MTRPLIIALPGNEVMAERLAGRLGAAKVGLVATNSVPHPSNAIDIAPAISATGRDLVGVFAARVENQKEERA